MRLKEGSAYIVLLVAGSALDSEEPFFSDILVLAALTILVDINYILREEAIEIVKQAANEYNNGWIPVEIKLPEEPEAPFTEEVIIEELILDGKIKECNIMIEGASISTTLYYAGNGY